MSKVPGKRSQQQNDFLEPGTPINVVATNVGTGRAFNNGAASISFSQPAGSPPADTFTVTVYKGSVQDSTATGTVGASSPIVVGGLDSSGSYKFTVSATNSSGATGESEFSTPITITTVPATPSAPTVQNFQNDQNDYLTWSLPNNGGSGLIGTAWESTDGKGNSVAAPGNTVTVPQEGGTSQQYRVRVENANGFSEWSSYSGPNTTPPFFPPFFPFFPPFFPFFPFFPPNFPFFPFFPPMFPFFPFFPPMFPFFPFFPPMFPFFPFFPPRFPFFPFFPPMFPVFKRFCLAADAPILTSNGWVEASKIELGSKIISIADEHIDMNALLDTKKSHDLDKTVSLVEVEVVSLEIKTSTLVGFNGLGKHYSVTQPIFVKDADGITYKNSEDVEIGDILLGVDAEGATTETVIVSIEKDEAESTVYEIRTAPQPWFITKSFIVIA